MCKQSRLDRGGVLAKTVEAAASGQAYGGDYWQSRGGRGAKPYMWVLLIGREKLNTAAMATLFTALLALAEKLQEKLFLIAQIYFLSYLCQ